ncbi:MAG TPA: hypothetical protein VEW48_26250 [Thermoanaerobaculia bacterium]|nr:hypothetical protein [Thermoanaerobaculia bacterium]
MSSRQEQALRERVRQHRICWHVWPEHQVRGSERLQVGFRLGLIGSQDRPGTRPITSSAEFWKLYTSLHDLARWILPQVDEESDLQVSVFDASLAPRGDRQDVMVTIKITHRQGFDHPVDAGELRSLADMEEKLLRLGAPQDQWQ